MELLIRCPYFYWLFSKFGNLAMIEIAVGRIFWFFRYQSIPVWNASFTTAKTSNTK
jgi:hypothetical protein